MNIPLNIDWQQILLHLLNFAILALGLYLLLYKPVKKFIQKRKDHYRQLDDESRQKQEDAQAKGEEYQKLLEGADSEIDKKRSQAARETEKAVAAQIDTARHQCDKMLAEARISAQKEHDRILAEAKEEIAQLAIDATEKLLKEKTGDMPGDMYDQFIAAAEKELKNG